MKMHWKLTWQCWLLPLVLFCATVNHVQAASLLQPDPAKTLFDQAMVKYNAKAYADAIPLFRQLVSQYPNSEWANDAQVGLGMSCFYQRDYKQAVAELGLVLKYPNSKYSDLAQFYIGEALYQSQEYVRAIEAYQRVLDSYPTSNWRGDALLGIGASYVQTDDLERARAILQKLVQDYPNSEYADRVKQILQQLDSTSPPAANAGCDALNQEGTSLYRQANYQLALAKFQAALTCYQKARNRQDEGTTLNNLGLVYFNLGQSQESLKYYQQALAIMREIGNRDREAISLNNVGGIYARLGQYQEALQYFQQALAIHREMDNRAGEGVGLSNIGSIYNRLGQYQEALQYYEQSLTILRASGDRAGEGVSLNNLGDVYSSLGQYQKAIQFYEQGLAIMREVNDRAGEGIGLGNLGSVYASQGQYQQALKYQQQALAIFRASGDQAREGRSLNEVGFIYSSLGKNQEALKYYQQALAILQKVGDQAGEGNGLNNLAGIYASLGQNQEALQHHQQALTIRREMGDRFGESVSLNNIGGIYTALGQYQEAIPYYEQSLAILREIGDRIEEGGSLNNMGFIYSSMGQYAKALQYYQPALAIAREVGNQAGESKTLTNLGYLYEQQGQLDQALGFYRQAIVVYESQRTSATVEEFRTALAALSADVYQQTILLLIKMNRPLDAFDLAERARARTLLDQLGNAHISPTASDNPALMQQEEQLRGEIQSLDRQLRDEWAKPQNQRSQEVIQSISAQLEARQADYVQLLTSLKVNNPEYASLVTVNPLTLTETQKILTNTTLVEYFVTVSQTVAFVITQNDFHSVQITVTQNSLDTAIREFHLSTAASLEGVPHSMQILYQYLIAPIEPYLKTDSVILAPHGVLHYVPFGALHDGKRYLIEKHTLSFIPSASVLPFAVAKRKAQVAAPLVLGDPDGSLPRSRQEAQAIAKMYGVTADVGQDALERRVWKQSKDAGILHLSTHGRYDSRSPLFSYVLLAGDDKEDGRLNVYEIYNRGLDLEKADLVVLSACETNVGELSQGDEIVGLSRALIYAGTPSVIASLWSVSDESTQVLMEKFYTHLRAGVGKAEALRAAQLEMIASGKYAHPYHWAAFGVTGDPGEGKGVSPGPRAAATAQVTPTPKTSASGKPSNPICPAAALPVALFVLIAVSFSKLSRAM